MAILGLQVVNVEGGPITSRQAVRRTIGLWLTLLTLGIGFLGIVFQRERRALDDFIAGTAVVYDWDARAARLRWIARNEGVLKGERAQKSHGGSPQGVDAAPPREGHAA
jgi:hypothetical protein